MFLFSGIVAIACVILLFANALYREDPAPSLTLSSIEQELPGEQSGQAAGQSLPSSRPAPDARDGGESFPSAE